MEEIDKLDKRILYLLDSNAALSYSEIARALKITPELARYRFLRLERDEIVEQAVADVDYFLLGYETYEVLVKLQSLEEEEIRRLAKEISELDSVAWIARFEGEYHLDIVVRVRTSLQLAAFLDELDRSCGEFLSRRSLQLNLGQRHLSRGYLAPRRKSSPTAAPQLAFNEATLDRIDAEICRVFQRDARISLRDLAEELSKVSAGEIDLSPEALAQRRTKLEKAGIIRSYLLVLNQQAIGLSVFRVLVSFQRMSAAQRERLLREVEAHPNCVFATRALGEWDAEFEFEVEGNTELRKVLAEVFAQRRKSLREYTILEQVERFRFSSKVLAHQ